MCSTQTQNIVNFIYYVCVCTLVFRWSTGYWFLVAIVARLLRSQKLTSLFHHPFHFPYPLYFS
jgi:hypothetical protein